MKNKIFFILYTIIITILTVNCKNPVSNKISINNEEVIALINGVLIDGTGSDPIPDIQIVVQNKKITYVGNYSESVIPPEARIIDVNSSYVLPGFMNTHIHSGYNENYLQKWARSGVTTVRDIGNLTTSPAEGFSIRNTLLNDNSNARLVAAGPLVTTIGGYGNYPVSSPDDAEQIINKLIDDGADLIKIAIEDNLQGRTWEMLFIEEIERIVLTAHKKNKRVAAHISRSHHLDMAIRCGVDDVDHMAVNFVPDSLINFMIEQNMYWVPTLELWKGVSDMYSLNWIDIAKSNLRRFVQAGGKIALGTDYDGYVTPFDLGMPITEIKLMEEAGMTPMQIIVAATKHGAFVCGLENELGTIEQGKIADIIVIKDNPLENLDALLNVEIVIHNGVIINE